MPKKEEKSIEKEYEITRTISQTVRVVVSGKTELDCAKAFGAKLASVSESEFDNVERDVTFDFEEIDEDDEDGDEE